MKNKLISLILILLLFYSYILGATNVETLDIAKNTNSPINKNYENVLINLDIGGISYGHELLWKVNTTGTNYEESAVTYVDDVAYIGSCSNHGAGHDKLFAVNTTNGKILWCKLTGPTYAGAVIDNNVIYIGSCSHGSNPVNEYIYAFERFNGTQIWKKQVYGGIAGPVQFDNANIYFCTFSNGSKVYSLNKTDGCINWKYNSGLTFCANIPMLKDNAIYAAFSHPNGKLVKLNATDGSEIWSTSIVACPWNNLITIDDNNQDLVKLNSTNRSEIRNNFLSSYPWDNSITADGDGRIFLGLYYSRKINAYTESDGSLIWTYSLHANPLSFNAYHNGLVFIADTGGYVYAINSTNGWLIWKNKIGSTIDISSPTLSGGLLFIGTRDFDKGAFFALDEISGKILWKYNIGSSVSAPPSIVNGMMLCGADDWHMYAFDFGIGSDDWKLHRYNNLNTAYSPYGLTQWQYVKSFCKSYKNKITCRITNCYDHDITKIKLKLDFNAYWYDSYGSLLKSKSDNYVVDSLPISSSTTFIITKEPLTNVKIIKLNKAIFLFNKEIIPFFTRLITRLIDF